MHRLPPLQTKIKGKKWGLKREEKVRVHLLFVHLYLCKRSLVICDSYYREIEANKSCPRVLLSIRIRVKLQCKLCVASPLCCSNSVRPKKSQPSSLNKRASSKPFMSASCLSVCACFYLFCHTQAQLILS